MNRGILPLRLALLACVAAVGGFAQTGQIADRVTDPAGAVVPQVKVTITQTTTGTQREAATNQDGYYTAPNLEPGPCSVSLTKEGFKPVSRTGIQLQVDQDLRLDFSLEVGQVNERIVVSSQAPLWAGHKSSICRYSGATLTRWEN